MQFIQFYEYACWGLWFCVSLYYYSRMVARIYSVRFTGSDTGQQKVTPASRCKAEACIGC